MTRYFAVVLALLALSACSSPEDVLENIGDVAVPDQLTGCVARADDGSCVKAVCVASDEDDCSEWVDACKEHDHIADVRGGHDTCARRQVVADD